MLVCLEITKISNDIKLGQDSTLVGEKLIFASLKDLEMP